jgi:membrane associated rhomboid family serine protease
MRYDANPFAGLPVVVKNLLIINVIMFLLKWTGLGNFAGVSMDEHFGLVNFSSPYFRPWQLVTHMFMHGDLLHLAFNMLGLFMLGPPLEYKWGSQRFLTFYMLTGVGAALFYYGVNFNVNYHLVGASGAIYGVLLAFGMTFPNVELMMFPLPIPIKAKYFVLLYGGITVYQSLQSNPGDNVAHLAHLGGMVVGFLLIRLWRHRGE